MAREIKPQKVLVTGGTGYLGACIGSALAQSGYEVVLGSRQPFSRGEVASCSQVKTDWTDPNLSFCKSFDVVVHAAGMNAQNCANDPEKALEFNGRCTERLIKRAVSYGCKRFYYLSTAHVYKSPLIGTFDELSPTLNTHPYATSHGYGEQALISELEKGAISGAVLRLSNCFGVPATKDNECWDLVLNQFVLDAVKQGVVNIRGNPQSKRDFLPISQLNVVLKKLLEKDTLPSEILNISTGISTKLVEVASLVSKCSEMVLGRKIPIFKNENSLIEDDLLIKSKYLSDLDISVDADLENPILDLIKYSNNE